MIHILLKNKLIALDVIVPLLLHIQSRNHVRFNFITFDEELIQTLEKNIVLKKIVYDLGNISYIGRFTRSNIFYSRIVNSFWLLKISLRLIVKKEPLIHFGMLNQYPLRLLYLINRKNTYICDKKAWLILKNKQDFTREKIIDKCQNVAASSSINFSNNSIYLKSKSLSSSNLVKEYNYFNPKKRKQWVNYVNRISDNYFQDEMKELNINADRIIAIIATKFGAHTENDSSGFERDLIFFETLIALADLSQKFPIAIKEHIYSDSNRMNSVIRLAKQATSGRLNCYLTKLHPSVLATRSIVSICHNTSATFYDFRCFNVPTVAICEYSFDSDNFPKDQTHTSKFINAEDLKNGDLERYINYAIKHKQQVEFELDLEDDIIEALI